MQKTKKIKVLFCDIGGVLLTNGWDHESRAKAVDLFRLDGKEFESRHQLIFGDFEVGKITLETYLHYTVFYKPQKFSYDSFVEFMHDQSKAFPDTIELIKKLKAEHGLKVVLISNEGRELNEFRTKTFKLNHIADFFIVSCFIGIRKPDKHVWEMALDFVQVPASETVYIDDRQLFVEIAQNRGIHSICHHSSAATSAALEKLLKSL